MSDETLPLSRKARRAGLFALLLPLAALGVGLYQGVIFEEEDRVRRPFDYLPLLGFGCLTVVSGYLICKAHAELDRADRRMRGHRWLWAATVLLVMSGLGSCCVYLPVTSIRPAANRMLNANNLRTLGIAMHEYHTDHFRLPAHAIYKDGKPLLSWRVAVLPYLGEQALYDEFHLNEPWYSEHNLSLLPRMPKAFKRPSSHRGGDTMTHYQVLVGPGAIFEGAKPRTLGEINRGDGTANTILIADALEPVPWTKPDDLPFDPNGPPPPFRFMRSGGVMVAFADCSTRSIRKPADESQLRLLRQLITWNGGEKEDASVLD